MKIIKRILLSVLIVSVLFILFGLYQVRYNGAYGRFDDSLRYLKYDEENEKFIFFGFLDYNLNGVDGPVVKRKGSDSLEISYILDNDGTFILDRSVVRNSDSLKISVPINNTDQDQFFVHLNEENNYDLVRYELPNKVLALSDIEGNFNALYGLLIANGVMNKNYEWTFGGGHVVCNGDFVDRGDDVLGCLWLLYKLQNQAKESGGKLHFILGNHELWNLQDYPKSVPQRLIAFAQSYSGIEEPVDAFSKLINDESVLSEWMRKQPILIVIGDMLFVHGGISVELVNKEWSIEKINKLFWNSINNETSAENTDIIFDEELGPLWNRTMVIPYAGHEKLSLENYNMIMNMLNVEKIVIGHSIVEEVSTDYGNSLYRIDVQHSEDKFGKSSQAVLFKEGKSFRVDAAGNEYLIGK